MSFCFIYCRSICYSVESFFTLYNSVCCALFFNHWIIKYFGLKFIVACFFIMCRVIILCSVFVLLFFCNCNCFFGNEISAYVSLFSVFVLLFFDICFIVFRYCFIVFRYCFICFSAIVCNTTARTNILHYHST